MISATKLLIASLLANGVAAFAPSKSSVPTPTSLDAWKGGFMESNPDYAYKPDSKPDLSDLDITGNLENIDKITRMQKILWPQFSWQSIPGDESSRVYEMFAQDISRIGYDDDGRIWSIICPQRGKSAGIFGTIMLEVTVNGVRGWVNEDDRSTCADMGVTGILWVEPSSNPLMAAFEGMLAKKKLPFSKANAVKVDGHALGKPYEPWWGMYNGTDPQFFHPQFCQHWDEAYSVYNLQVEIGTQIMVGDPFVDDFNKMVIDTFNGVAGNILAPGQKVAWNVWAGEPEEVDQDEWRNHADLWLHSITVEHKYPTGDTGAAQYFDGTEYPVPMTLEDQAKIIKEFIAKHGSEVKDYVKPEKLEVFRFFKDYLLEEKRLFKKLKRDD